MAYKYEQEFEQNMGLIYLVINQLNYNMDKDDQFQCGGLGLMYAIEHYDPSQGYSFSTYATSVIKYYILNAYKEELQYTINTVSLDTPILTSDKSNNIKTIADTIFDQKADTDNELFFNRDFINRLLDLLTPQEKQLLTLRYLQEMPLSKIATKFNLNEFTVQKALHKALQHCRKLITENNLYI